MVRRIALVLCATTGCYSGAGAGADDDASGGPGSADDDADDDDDGADDDDGDGDSGGVEPEEYDFERAQMRRLTRLQFEGSLRSLLGDDIVVSSEIDPDLVAELFTTVGASTVSTSPLGVEQYELATLDAVGQAFADPEARLDLVGCDVAEDDGCAASFLADFARRAWRRPIADDELARYVDLVTNAPGIEGDAWLGLQLATAGVLQSPNFLYLVEIGEPDPDVPERWRYTNWEMAGRLATFVWAAAPDDELLDAAEAGDLTTEAGVAEQLDRMLADPRAKPALARFFGELLHLDVADTIAKDIEIYPAATPVLFQAMRGEVERIVDRIAFEEDADLRDLFDTRETYVTPELAELYGMTAPDPALADEDGFVPVTIPDDWARLGVLGTGMYLASTGTLTRTSPTVRGLFIQRRLRCNEIPPPPDDVDAEFPPGSEGEQTTMRERLEIHRENPTCAGCHDQLDPIGLVMEHFDGLGRHRDTDNGLELDVSGTLDGQSFDGLAGLVGFLREDPATTQCLVRQAYRFATGHHESAEEGEILEALIADFDESGYRFGTLARDIVLSEGFRFRGRAP